MHMPLKFLMIVVSVLRCQFAFGAEEKTRSCDFLRQERPAELDQFFSEVSPKPSASKGVFIASKLNPFFAVETVTQFVCSKPLTEILAGLEKFLNQRGYSYEVNHESGSIRFSCFFNFGHVEAAFRVWRLDSEKFLVSYAPNSGDVMSSYRLFYELVNGSGLINLEIPRILRSRSRAALKTDFLSDASAIEAQTIAPEALLVFIGMLNSCFWDDIATGAKGLARECSYDERAALYVKHLPAIIHAFKAYVKEDYEKNFLSRDIVPCLAFVLSRVGSFVMTEQGEEASEELKEVFAKHQALIEKFSKIEIL